MPIGIFEAIGIIGAEYDLAVDALSKTLDLFEIELEEVHEHRRI
jgi:hypothetical protein